MAWKSIKEMADYFGQKTQLRSIVRPGPEYRGSYLVAKGLNVYYSEYVWWVNTPTIYDYVDQMFEEQENIIILSKKGNDSMMIDYLGDLVSNNLGMIKTTFTVLDFTYFNQLLIIIIN